MHAVRQGQLKARDWLDYFPSFLSEVDYFPSEVDYFPSEVDSFLSEGESTRRTVASLLVTASTVAAALLEEEELDGAWAGVATATAPPLKPPEGVRAPADNASSPAATVMRRGR